MTRPQAPGVAGRARAIVLAGLVSALASLPATGVAAPLTGRQPSAPPARRTALVEQWLSAVEAHVPGDVDSALLGVAALSSDDLRVLWGDVQVLLQIVERPSRTRFDVQPLAFESTPRPGSVPPVTFRADERVVMDALAARVRARGVNGTLRRAAVVHTDVITLAPQVAATSAGATAMSAPVWIYIDDGGRLGMESVSLHWQIGRLSVGSMTPDPRQVEFVRDWYRATVAYQQGRELFDANQLGFAVRLFPADAVLLLLAGCQHEAFASPLFQAFARTPRAPGQAPGIKSPRDELAEAEQYFRRALAVDPSLVEARIRWGRVLAQRGRPIDAVRELTGALEVPLEPVLEYFAALFLGVEHQAAGRWTEARAALTRAAAAMPKARVPHLALAQVARELGDREAVTTQLTRALADVPDEQLADPWWAYRRAQGRAAEAWITRVRALAAEAGR